MDVDGYTLWVAGGSLLLVAPQVSESECRNVLSTLRYVQMLADSLVESRFGEPRRWYRAYRNALGKRGWGVTHSYQSVEVAGHRTVLAPLQPLQLWLTHQHPEIANVLERCLDGLDPAQPGIEQLARSSLQRLDAPLVGARIVLELGLVRPGARLSLCSLAMETRVAPGTDWLTAAVPGESLRGDLHVQGVLVEPAPELLETGRDAFARLVSGGDTFH